MDGTALVDSGGVLPLRHSSVNGWGVRAHRHTCIVFVLCAFYCEPVSSEACSQRPVSDWVVRQLVERCSLALSQLPPHLQPSSFAASSIAAPQLPPRLQLLSPVASSIAAPQLPPRLQLPAPTASCLLHCSSPNCHLTCNHRPLLHPPLQLPIYHLACNCCHLLHPFLHCSSPVTTSLATVVSCCILQSTAAPQLPCTSLATGSTSALTYCTAASGPNCHLTCNYRPLLHPPGMAAPQLPPHLQLLSLAAASTAQLVSSPCLLHYSSPIDISLSTAVTRCCLRPLHSLLVLPLPRIVIIT